MKRYLRETVITVQDAASSIAKRTQRTDTVSVALHEARGRISRQPIIADRDLPPYDRATMDGIAIRFSAYASGSRSFDIVATIAAGTPAIRLAAPRSCVEIMTGAPVPDGADCVVRIEDVRIENGIATIVDDAKLEPGLAIHRRGSDAIRGAILVEERTAIDAKTISVAASVGLSEIATSRIPSIVIATTGDELVSIETQPQPHQIRRSNDMALEAALHSAGYGRTQTLHIADDPNETKEALAKTLDEADFLILAGGVSKGKFDYVPDALQSLGVEKAFQWVSQRPGKPFWFGTYNRNGYNVSIFALPGNPASCFTCLHRYAIPALDLWTGKPPEKARFAKLGEDVSFKPPLTLFLPAILDYEKNGEIWAAPLPLNTSGDFVSLARTDGFLELPKERSTFAKGEVFQFRPWA